MRPAGQLAVALSAAFILLWAPSLTLGQEVQGPELYQSYPPAEGSAPEQGMLVSPTIGAPTSRPVWLERPDAEDLRRHFPREALRAGVTGRVILECLVRGDGSLLCVVVSENPQDRGFGEAALKIVEDYKASMLLQDGSDARGARVRLPVTFAVADETSNP